MMQASNREIEIYDVVISSLTGEFQLRTEVTKVDRATQSGKPSVQGSDGTVRSPDRSHNG